MLSESHMSTSDGIHIRPAKPSEYTEIGQLLVEVYSNLEGFPKEKDQPAYYNILRSVSTFASNPGTEILVAVTNDDTLLGAVVYVSDMKYYGSGGTATTELNSAGFRLLAVNPGTRGKGIGKLLTLECIQRARSRNLRQVIIHTTKAMMTAWAMYERIGFVRATDLDFMQGELPVYGFRLMLDSTSNNQTD